MRYGYTKWMSLYGLVLGLVFMAVPMYAQGEPLKASAFYHAVEPGASQASITKKIITGLRHNHYKRLRIDDEFSAELLDAYIHDLDPSRIYFMKSDIDEFHCLSSKLDDDLEKGDVKAAFEIFNRYQKRVCQRLVFLLNTLDKGIKDMAFTTQESLLTSREDLDWGKNTEQINALWIRRLKADVLSLKLADKPKPDARIAQDLYDRYHSRLSRIQKTKPMDVFSTFMNAVCSMYGPHTQYLPPRASENFNINMSLSLEGIGAMLRSDNEYVRVVRLITAGPADKDGQLKPSDRIVGVGQDEEGPLVDVIGWRLDDVVDLIRGPKGTTVRLNVIPSDAQDEHMTRIVRIKRDTVKLEEQSAKSMVMDITIKGEKHRIGIIDIPAFYLDFNAMASGDPDYRSTTRDVTRLIKGLKKDKVEGIVIDLRNDGGGSLQEVNSLVGLFIRNGPTVQIKDSRFRTRRLYDKDSSVLYDGPLAVVINRLSASASEIFAGAIQDYKRGIVIGNTSFGKGTVQTLVPIDKGQLKVTTAKFYRISGESTQNRGVIPDLIYPGLYNPDEIGESTLDHALVWDTIKPARFPQYLDLDSINAKIKEDYLQYIEKDPDYIYRIGMINLLDEMSGRKKISLNAKNRKKQREENSSRRLELENTRLKALDKKQIKDLDELKEDEEDTDYTTIKEDSLLRASGHVLLDIKEMLYE
ncbi:MAG: carboxy terminal-processing peptidase [Thermodesulfobacteriota bacterium]|nr:carboxy terminal-processing peptidase [Thermodesulfobacteriota bacterium]